jgi:hypothetical protein
MADPQNGNNFGAVYTDKAQYDAAMAEWQRKKAAGDPFPGPMPRMDVPGQIEGALAQSNYPTELPNQQMWIDRTRAGANAAPNANPYSTIVANQARPAQEALYAQMRAQQAGPSIAGMQGARAQGQNLQAALGAGGGRATMQQAGAIGGGLAGDTGMGQLAEQLRMSQGLGNMSGGVRGADLGVAGAQANAGLQQRGLDDAMRQFYATQGSALNNTIGRNDLEAFKLRERLKLQAKKNDMAKADQAASTGATVAGGFM